MEEYLQKTQAKKQNNIRTRMLSIPGIIITEANRIHLRQAKKKRKTLTDGRLVYLPPGPLGERHMGRQGNARPDCCTPGSTGKGREGGGRIRLITFATRCNYMNNRAACFLHVTILSPWLLQLVLRVRQLSFFG